MHGLDSKCYLYVAEIGDVLRCFDITTWACKTNRSNQRNCCFLNRPLEHFESFESLEIRAALLFDCYFFQCFRFVHSILFMFEIQNLYD